MACAVALDEARSASVLVLLVLESGLDPVHEGLLGEPGGGLGEHRDIGHLHLELVLANIDELGRDARILVQLRRPAMHLGAQTIGRQLGAEHHKHVGAGCTRHLVLLPVEDLPWHLVLGMERANPEHARRGLKRSKLISTRGHKEAIMRNIMKELHARGRLDSLLLGICDRTCKVNDILVLSCLIQRSAIRPVTFVVRRTHSGSSVD